MTAVVAGPQAPSPGPGTVPGRAALTHRLAERGVDRLLLLAVPAALALIALFCYPFLYGLQLSFQPAHGGVLGAYRAFFTDPFARKSVWQTFSLAIPASLINPADLLPDAA